MFRIISNALQQTPYSGKLLFFVLASTFSNTQAQTLLQSGNAVLPPCPQHSNDATGDGNGFAGYSCLVTVESIHAPVVTNIETGQPVELSRVFWTPEDFIDRTIVCQYYRENFNQTQYELLSSVFFLTHTYANPQPPFLGTVTLESVNTQNNRSSFTREGAWGIQNGLYQGLTSPFESSDYIETTDDGINIWSPHTIGEFYSCKPLFPGAALSPTSLPPTTTIADVFYIECLDTAPLGNGWGWDGHGSCRHVDNTDNPAANWRYVSPGYVGVASLNSNSSNSATGNHNSNACDYTNASGHDGWGWNPITQESCEPLSSSPGNSQSINQTSSQSIDQTGSQSAEPTTCIDTDGDGWGWDGIASCRVGQTIESGCDYTDANLYDGWGWNPITQNSCPPE